MAKKKPETAAREPEEAKRPQVYLDADVARKARIIAGALGMSLPDYVNNRLGPLVDAELPKVMAELGFDITSKKG